MNWPSNKDQKMLYENPIKSISVETKLVQQDSGWLRIQGKGEKFIDPGSELARRSGSTGPGSQCPAGPQGQSGRGWRSCQGPDSFSTSNGR